MIWTKSLWISQLRNLYPAEVHFRTWLIATNSNLGGRTPIQALFDGDEHEVAKLIDQLVSGAHL